MTFTNDWRASYCRQPSSSTSTTTSSRASTSPHLLHRAVQHGRWRLVESKKVRQVARVVVMVVVGVGRGVGVGGDGGGGGHVV